MSKPLCISESDEYSGMAYIGFFIQGDEIVMIDVPCHMGVRIGYRTVIGGARNVQIQEQGRYPNCNGGDQPDAFNFFGKSLQNSSYPVLAL